MLRFSRAWTALALAAALAGCTSPYAHNTLIGGFSETRLAPNMFRVNYDGNGNTPEEQVVDYWLYRCAELTLQNGYSYFGMVPEKSSIRDDAAGLKHPAAWHPGEDDPHFIKVRGGGYVYIPSYSTVTVHTWHKHGTIAMYNSRLGAFTPEQVYALHARTVMAKLADYVRTAGRTPAPPRKELIEAAMRYSPDLGTGAFQELPAVTVRPSK